MVAFSLSQFCRGFLINVGHFPCLKIRDFRPVFNFTKSQKSKCPNIKCHACIFRSFLRIALHFKRVLPPFLHMICMYLFSIYWQLYILHVQKFPLFRAPGILIFISSVLRLVRILFPVFACNNCYQFFFLRSKSRNSHGPVKLNL